jgi:superfamily II DNA/RNA helicase
MKYTQVLLFSASIDKKTRKEANSLTYKAIDININAIKNSESIIPSSIKHNYVITDRRERIETLRKLVKAVKPVKCIIFINTIIISRLQMDIH